MPIKMPELLAPAGNFEKLIIAVHYGADAVYLGNQEYSLRAHASNFSDEELEAAVCYAHDHGVKAYVTVNIFARNHDLERLADHLCYLQNIRVDGIIIADPGIFRVARQVVPGMPVHLSTQANVTNAEQALFWQDHGIRRINLARELELSEIAAIKKATSLEVEVFVHGAICISYSGRCLLSHYFTGRDANHGDCAQPCRYFYALAEEKRPGLFFPIEEDRRGTYILNARDLCLINRLPELVLAGVDSVKIEGRMKGIYYVGSVVRVYRAALDFLAGMDTEVWQRPSGESALVPGIFLEELARVGTRGYTENFLTGPPGPQSMLYDAPREKQQSILAGVVLTPGPEPQIEARNPLRPGEQIEYLGKGITALPFTIKELRNSEGICLAQANPGDRVFMRAQGCLPTLEKNGLLRTCSKIK